LIGATQIGQVDNGGIKTEKIAALSQTRGLIIACAGGVKLRLDGLASGEKFTTVVLRSETLEVKTSPVKRVAEICIRHFFRLLWNVKRGRFLPLVGVTISQQCWAQYEELFT